MPLLGFARPCCFGSLPLLRTLGHAVSAWFRLVIKIVIHILDVDCPILLRTFAGWPPLPSRQFDAIAGDVFPELYQAFVSKLDPFNLDLDFVFSYSCLVANDFYDHLTFATITPFLALVVLEGSYFIGRKINSCSESTLREVRHKHQAAVFYVAFLVYAPVSYRIFQTFGCDPLDHGETYLRADYSLSCLTTRHSWYKVYALKYWYSCCVRRVASFGTGVMLSSPTGERRCIPSRSTVYGSRISRLDTATRL